MLEQVLLHDRSILDLWSLDDQVGVHEEAILSVLERAAEDNDFLARLADQDPQALADYDLTWDERAALLSGDIQWVESRVGKLDARQRTWLDCRLQQEIW